MIAAILIPLGLALMVILENWLFGKFWDRNLSVEISFDTDAETVGRETSVTQTVSNGKLMPVSLLQVGYETDLGLDVMSGNQVSISDHVNIVELFSLHPFEQTTRKIRIHCAKRGYYRILRTSLTAHNVFGRSQQYKNLDQHTELYVFPELIRLQSLNLAVDRLSGDLKARRRLYEDPFLFRGIRDYTNTDPMSSINWKASARTGELKVNLRDYTAGQKVYIMLNLENPGTPYADDLLEDGIRIAATVADRLVRLQIPIGFITNGRDILTGESPYLETGSSEIHYRSLLEMLSRLRVGGQTESFAGIVEDRALHARTSQEACCIISTVRSDAVVESAHHLALAQGSLLWICPLLKEMADRSMPDPIHLERVEHDRLA